MIVPILRHVAQVEAHDLRRFPPRLWPLVEQNAKGLRMSCLANGRIVKAAPLEVAKNVRVP